MGSKCLMGERLGAANTRSVLRFGNVGWEISPGGFFRQGKPFPKGNPVGRCPAALVMPNLRTMRRTSRATGLLWHSKYSRLWVARMRRLKSFQPSRRTRAALLITRFTQTRETVRRKIPALRMIFGCQIAGAADSVSSVFLTRNASRLLLSAHQTPVTFQIVIRYTRATSLRILDKSNRNRGDRSAART